MKNSRNRPRSRSHRYFERPSFSRAARNNGQQRYLIHQEGEHRQLGEHRRQMLFAVAEVVFEAIALVLQQQSR